MDKLELIKNYWKDNLIKLTPVEILFEGELLTENILDFVSNIGLPIVIDTFEEKFLPFTYWSKLQQSGFIFYIIGEITPYKLRGISLLSIKEGSDDIFKINRKHNGLFEINYINKDLLSFFYFFTLYNDFKYNYTKGNNFTKDKFNADYLELIQNMKEQDRTAFEEENTYWSDKLDYVKVDFIEFFPVEPAVTESL